MNAHTSRALAVLAGFLLLSATAARAQVIFTGSYTQTFTTGTNGVSASTQINTAGNYTWTDNSTITGWYAVVNGATPTEYHASNINGNNGTPNNLKLARASGSSGALGTRRATNNSGFTAFGVQFVNSSGATITALDVSYLGQQWQHNSGGADALTFQYSLDATSLTTGTWTTVNALTFNSLFDSGDDTGLPSLAPTGSSVAPGVTIASSITGLSLAVGNAIWFRWVDVDNTGVDQTLTIDDLTVTAVPEPSTVAGLAGLAALVVGLGRRGRRRDAR